MLDGAMLAFADQRRAREDDGEHGDVVDDLHQSAEPDLVQSRVEAGAQLQVHGQCAASPVTLHELVDFGQHDLLHVSAAGERLAHARGIHVQLQFGLSAGQHIALEVGRNGQREGEIACIQPGIHMAEIHHLRRHELRRVERRGDACGQWRLVFVDDGNRRLVQRIGHGRGRGVHRGREGVDDEHQHHRVAPQAPQLLDAQAPDIFQAMPHGVSP
ncbi:hypothetical protein SDC9_97484 [bioreactor metagenome]|uniref:Uncharacterized protein n=1 Tax=bioreactor metagenome TaxID=1076179 RepID=A0A645AEN4_9ZZZZ